MLWLNHIATFVFLNTKWHKSSKLSTLNDKVNKRLQFLLVKKNYQKPSYPNNCQKTDSLFHIFTSISYLGYPLVPGGQGELSELDFKGSGYDPEDLGVLGVKNHSKIGIFWLNLASVWGFLLLAPPKPQGRTQNPWNWVLRVPPDPQIPMSALGTEC